MLVVRERWVGDGDRLLNIDPSSSDHSSTSFSSWLGLLNRGSLRAQSPLSAAGSHLGILSPTDSNWLEPPRAPGYIIVLRSPASAVLPLIYTGASLDWRLSLGSVCYTTRRSLKYAPKEFSNVNACARDPPWCYKNIQFSRQHRSVTHANPEWYVLFSQRRRVHLIFKQRCHVTISSWIKILSTLLPQLAFTVVTWYTNRCIHFYISAPNKKINFFIFCSTIVNMSFH